MVKVAAVYFGLCAFVVVVAVAIAETVELLIGSNERDVSRSGRWVRRLAELTNILRGAWTLCTAWTLAVFLVSSLGMETIPTAADRWNLLAATGTLALAWLVAEIVRNGVHARHSERIDMATRRRGER